MNDRKLVEIEQQIYSIRGVRVMLDSYLAAIYGVSAKRLNEQVRRNPTRFPKDFAFQVSPLEYDALRSQIATLNIAGGKGLRYQIGTLKTGRGQHRKYCPWAFTEYDVRGRRRMDCIGRWESDRALGRSRVNTALSWQQMS